MAQLPDIESWVKEAGEKGAQYALKLLEQEYGVSAHRLHELAEADRDGRCVVLPCKIGTAIYTIQHQKVPDDEYRMHFHIEIVENLEQTERGNGGFGSTGR